jgi:hypothetical protein
MWSDPGAEATAVGVQHVAVVCTTPQQNVRFERIRSRFHTPPEAVQFIGRNAIRHAIKHEDIAAA